VEYHLVCQPGASLLYGSHNQERRVNRQTHNAFPV